ncbi:MAG: metallophosphoesterase [Candidatus Eremiobacteraeota bacterium]|nr:metallophosphoesterase [Candidatus Eremiobacteraeota bacterium]
MWEWLRPRLVRVEVVLAGLPAAFEGLTIGHLSDLHRGPLVPPRLLARGVDLLREQAPDLIALTGDFVSVSGRYAPSVAQILSPLRARLGVYAVLGNHDHREGPARISRALEAVGIEMLTNRAVRLGLEGWVVGVDDVNEGNPLPEQAMAGIPCQDFTILLCHQPDFAVEAAGLGINLQLSGHSHGGQLELPWLGRLVLPEQAVLYPAGLARVAATDTWVYTNVGLGIVTAPIRYRCPPEVAVLTLKRAK